MGRLYNVEKEELTESGVVVVVVVVVLAILLLIGSLMAGCPRYNVWQKGLAGKSQLRKAEWNRQIVVQEANAKKESATLLAEAEVIRAGGIAKANEIIGKSITKEYLKYLFIEGLNDGNTEVIYVPTEANLPILEARDKRIR